MEADALLTNAAQLVPRCPRRRAGDLRRRLGMDHEYSDLRWRVVVCAHRRRELPIAHGTVEPRGPPGTEYHGEQVQRRRIGMKRARRAPTEGKLRLANVAGPFAVAESIGTLLRGTGRAHGLTSGQ